MHMKLFAFPHPDPGYTSIVEIHFYYVSINFGHSCMTLDYFWGRHIGFCHDVDFLVSYSHLHEIGHTEVSGVWRWNHGNRVTTDRDIANINNEGRHLGFRSPWTPKVVSQHATQTKINPYVVTFKMIPNMKLWQLLEMTSDTGPPLLGHRIKKKKKTATS